MNKKYKETFSCLTPSEEAVERAMEIAKTKKKKSNNNVGRVAIAFACIAVIIACACVIRPIDKTADPDTSVPDTITSDSSKVAPGFAIIAYADDSTYDFRNPNVKTPLKSKIGAIDIRGKEQSEVDEIVDKLYEDYLLSLWSFPAYEEDGKNVLTLLDTNTTAYKNAVIYQFRNGFFDVDLSDSNIVKEIRATNENKDLHVVMSSFAIYYDENGDLKDEYKMYTKSIHKLNDLNYEDMKYAVISGEEYKRDKELEKKHGKRFFGISLDMTDDLVVKLNDNPDYDLSQIKDTLTIEVEFVDGSVSQSKLDISLDSDGYIYAQNNSFEYIEN